MSFNPEALFSVVTVSHSQWEEHVGARLDLASLHQKGSGFLSPFRTDWLMLSRGGGVWFKLHENAGMNERMLSASPYPWQRSSQTCRIDARRTRSPCHSGCLWSFCCPSIKKVRFLSLTEPPPSFDAFHRRPSKENVEELLLLQAWGGGAGDAWGGGGSASINPIYNGGIRTRVHTFQQTAEGGLIKEIL